jgi:hypothetical protein
VNTSDESPWYISRRRQDLREYVTEKPAVSLAIAATVGFIVGGGTNSRLCVTFLAFIGRMAVREAATHFIIGNVIL